MPRPTMLFFSGGKDSVMALHRWRENGVPVDGLITTFDPQHDRVPLQGLSMTVLRAQAKALALPLLAIPLPQPCPNAVYRSRLLIGLRAHATAARLIFGDIHLQDIRDYREALFDGSGFEPLFPLWGNAPGALAAAIIDSGIRARITTVDPRRLSSQWLGREYDHALLRDLPADVDVCGENGEFHTVVWDAPDFSHSLRLNADGTFRHQGQHSLLWRLRPAADAGESDPG